MKRAYGTILVLSTATLVLLTASLACLAAEEKEEKVWRDEGPRHRGGQFELTDEVIEHVMERLRETNAERAEELAKLREKKPKQFEAELREIMREQFAGRFRAGRGPGTEAGAPFGGRGGFGGGPGGRGPGPEEGAPFGGRGGLGGGGFGGVRGGIGREMSRERMRERYAEYYEWLEKNYPEEAEKLAELKEKEPELHMRQFWLSHKKYRRIFEASEENPELAEVLKEDLVLKDKRNKLLRKIGAASEDEKKELAGELEELVSSRFDLIVKRKQITHEQLRKELEELKERVKKSEAEVEKWKEMKGEKVKERLEELIGRTEKFDWY